MEDELRSQAFPVEDFRDVWRNLPRESYWVELILDHIKPQYDALIHARKTHQVLGEYRKYTDPQSLVSWIKTDLLLQEAFGRYRNSRAPHIYTEFAKDCAIDTRRSVEKWVMNVEDQQILSIGQFLEGKGLLDASEESPPVYRTLAAARGQRRLEWSDDTGRCYVETQNHRKSRNSITCTCGYVGDNMN